MRTRTRSAALVLAVAAAAAAACQSSSDGATPSAPSAASHDPRSPVFHPHVELDALDSRTPVPLLPAMALHQKQNMQDHLAAVQEIVTALGARDFEAVDSAARRIGHSPPMERMCNQMGAAAPGFTERALSFHRTADGIAAAARARDERGVLAALGDTLRACTGCHATYKQQLVAELPRGRPH